MATTENTNRRSDWFAVGAFSTIALVAITSDMSGDLGDQNDEVKWSAISLIIGLAVSGLAFFAHFLGKMFVGTLIEGFLGLTIFGILAGGISTIMNPDHAIAQTGTGGIANANLYFFSWGAFICALQVFAKYLRDIHGIGATTKDFSAMGWTGFAAASFVVMAAATRLFKSTNCDDIDSNDGSTIDAFCDRTKLAFALGAISGLLGILWVVLGSFLPAMVDALMGVAMLAAWCFGVGYITFGGNKAPAQELGNLYFATWACFIMATRLASDGVGKTFGALMGGGGDTQEAGEEPAVDTPMDEEKGDEKGEKSGDEEGGDGHDSA